MSSELPYTIDEVLDNFSAVLEDLDFSRELAILGIKRLHFRRRQRLVRELRALSVALWRLALQRSFPHNERSIFESFLFRIAQHPDHKREKQAAVFIELIHGYLNLLQEKGDSDFMVASRHIVDLFRHASQDTTSQSLKLALLIRNKYTIIFERLI